MIKTIWSAALIFFVFVLQANPDLEPTTANGRLEVSFDSTMQLKDLVKIKRFMKEKGITLKYRSLAFDEQGGLKSLNIKVDCHDGIKGSASTCELNGRWGFFRDYREEALVGFGIGTLE
ncbi:MAG: hypothetical protein ACFHWX_23205 [Bacteroidota bacterium]